jgi:asparagine N-glycosylation enzyme membrane subunit Stt3
MPGVGRRADPRWAAIGFVIGAIPGIYFHQVAAGLGIGMALGVAFGLIREDIRNKNTRPADPLWFLVGLLIGILGGVYLYHVGLGLGLSLGLGIALGVMLGAVTGTVRADLRR